MRPSRFVVAYLMLLLGAQQARPQLAPAPPPAAATWRFELDSLDWRYRLTIRIPVARPRARVLVIRTASTAPPRAAVQMRSITSETNVDPAKAMAWVETPGTPSEPRHPVHTFDSLAFAVDTPLTRASVIRGHHEFIILADESTGARLPGLPRLVGDFAATWDPTPSVRPRTMSDSLQSAILQRALWDAGAHWMESQIHIVPGDSSHDGRLLKAFLLDRYGAALTVDTVETDFKRVFMRVRGRYRPLVCEMDDGRLSCYTPWKDVLRSMLPGRAGQP